MDFLLEIIMTPTVLACIKIAVIILLFAMPLGTVLTLMERKWSAMIQDRVGPNRANIGKFTGHGVLHLAADGLKSIFKEDTIPKGANGFLYLIAPFFGLIAAVATFAIIPIAGPIGDFTFQVTDVNPGLLFIFANITKCIRSCSCWYKLKQQVCSTWWNTGLGTNDFIRSLHGAGFDGYFYGLRNNSSKRNRQWTK